MTDRDRLHRSAVRLLAGWRAPDAAQEELRRDYLAHLARHPDGARRDGPPAHLTASCFVLDAGAERVLLTLHVKGRFWVQPGGHCEPGDADLAAAARREALEESGLTDLSALLGPVDLHRHALAGAFGRCREHLDVAFAATAPADAVPVVSPESDAVAWWPVTGLPDGVVADVPDRLARVVALVRRQSGSGAVSASAPRSSTIPSSRAAETPSR